MIPTAPDADRYFAQVAEQWDEMRSGYFTEAMREAAIAKAQALSASPLTARAVVADVGTGTGFMIQGLAPKAARVFGFDASAEMLAVARRNLAAFDNVTLRQARADRLPIADGALDAVFANMVLHHMPRPAAAINEMARALKPGGVLCLIDLDSHDQEWQREQMADRWLGFERAEVRGWFTEAGLEEVDVDCAEGVCCATSPDGTMKPLSIFVAIGRKA